MKTELDKLIYLSRNYRSIKNKEKLVNELHEKYKNKSSLEIDSFLADIFRKFEEYEKSEIYSRRTLHNIDKYSLKKNKSLNLYRTIIKSKIFSYSLFGKKLEYYLPLVESLNNIQKFLPNYTVVVYVDSSVDNDFIYFMEKNRISIKYQNDSINLSGTLWRFKAIDDYNDSWINFRDADSIITKREILILKYLEECKKYDYIIRDSISHCHPMLAGLFGMGSKPKQNITELIENYQNKDIRGADQFFLSEYFWQWYKYKAVHLNRFYKYEFKNTNIKDPDEINKLSDQRLHIGSKIASNIDLKVWLNLRYQQIELKDKFMIQKIFESLE